MGACIAYGRAHSSPPRYWGTFACVTRQGRTEQHAADARDVGDIERRHARMRLGTSPPRALLMAASVWM